MNDYIKTPFIYKYILSSLKTNNNLIVRAPLTKIQNLKRFIQNLAIMKELRLWKSSPEANLEYLLNPDFPCDMNLRKILMGLWRMSISVHLQLWSWSNFHVYIPILWRKLYHWNIIIWLKRIDRSFGIYII